MLFKNAGAPAFLKPQAVCIQGHEEASLQKNWSMQVQ